MLEADRAESVDHRALSDLLCASLEQDLVKDTAIDDASEQWDVHRVVKWGQGIVRDNASKRNPRSNKAEGGHVSAVRGLYVEARSVPWAAEQTYEEDDEGVRWRRVDAECEKMAWQLMPDPQYQKVYYPHILCDEYMVDAHLTKAFKIFDFDCNKFLDDRNELLQLTTNVTMGFKIFLWATDRARSG